jgi:hypothetical protein
MISISVEVHTSVVTQCVLFTPKKSDCGETLSQHAPILPEYRGPTTTVFQILKIDPGYE